MRGKDRFRFGSWGAFGGGSGTCQRLCRERSVTSCTTSASARCTGPELGEVIRLWSGGGGGYGDPLTRDAALVARDVADELVSVARAAACLWRRAARRRGGRGGDGTPAGGAGGGAAPRRRPMISVPHAREWERVHGVRPA